MSCELTLLSPSCHCQTFHILRLTCRSTEIEIASYVCIIYSLYMTRLNESGSVSDGNVDMLPQSINSIRGRACTRISMYVYRRIISTQYRSMYTMYIIDLYIIVLLHSYDVYGVQR